jgi:predicted lysophospholipase L1 biosynthesis ABC-type transport system permease subunit
VVVINTKLAKLDWPDSEPIGQTVLVDGTPAQIVGVVGDVHETGLDGDAPAMVYQPQAQATDGMTRAVARWFPTSVILRTPVAPSLKSIAAIVNSIDPAQPVRDVRSLESVMSASMGSRRFVQMLLTIFAGLALVLASVGVYGVVAYSVARRRREIGLRMALGASQSGVLGLILLEGLRVAAVGLLVGVIASFAATRLLRTLLFGVGPTNPVVFLAGVLALLITSVVASLIPSERAARVDPVEALRAE